MFLDSDLDFGVLVDSITEVKGNCRGTSCLRGVIDFLHEQIESLEDECEERERDVDLFNGEE
tara:strand:- start:11292 stop:11477 length:186 start_codon:yes stop_codon:yes gene_type:complete